MPVLLVSMAVAQQPERPPAVPLITHDPYFSVWSMADQLTDQNTKHWTGVQQPIAGLVRIDGVAYRFMGTEPKGVPAMQQVSLSVGATNTDYIFDAAGIRLSVNFFTPAFPQDIDLLSRPVTYLTWGASATDGKSHQVSLCLDVDPRIAVNSDDEPVVWGRTHAKGLSVLSVGSQEQRPLNRSGDDLRIDWGYFHLAVPDSQHDTLVLAPAALRSFAASGTLPDADDMEMPQSPRRGAAHLVAEIPINVEPGQTTTRHVLLSYTQGFAIEYLERKLKPYWQRDGETTQAMLAEAEQQYPSLKQRGDQYDKELEADLQHVGGEQYAQLAILAYRQTLAAHKIVAGADGSPLMFSKENFSNGCISTVDVLYPASPFFLLLNPKLLEAQMTPILDYAELPRWRWPFAPHDLGQYPLANGQV